MADIEKLIKTTMQEIEKMLNTKTVVGEPISVENSTVIPLVSFGFGFGVGTGSGTGHGGNKGEGEGSGTGGGGGIKPVAVIIADKGGIRIEPIKSGVSHVMEKVVETVGEMAKKKKEDSSK